MRILASGDHHFDEHRRLDECVRVHDWMVGVARRESVDLFLSAGDIYERASTPVERRAVAEWLTAMAEVCPVVIARGNHDRPKDAELLSRLRTKHPVIVEERAGVHRVAGAAVAAMAWPDRAALAASVGARDSETIDVIAREAFRAVLLGLRQELETHDGPRIGLGHWMIDGAVVSTGQPLLGMPLNVGLQELALLDAPLILAGHIHRSAEWMSGNSRILYTGSPFRTDFSQLEEKSVVIAEFDGPRLVSVIRVPTPCTKMIHLDDEWGAVDAGSCPGGWMVGDGDPRDFPGAEIRFRYRVAADCRDAARAAARDYARKLMQEDGALSVKLEEVVIPTTRARAPEIAAATTLASKLDCLWTSRGDDLPEDRRARLLGKVAELEEEVADAAHT